MEFKQNVHRINRWRTYALKGFPNKLMWILFLDIEIYILTPSPRISLSSVCGCRELSILSFDLCLSLLPPPPDLVPLFLFYKNPFVVVTVHLRRDSGVDFCKLVGEFLIGRPGAQEPSSCRSLRWHQSWSWLKSGLLASQVWFCSGMVFRISFFRDAPGKRPTIVGSLMGRENRQIIRNLIFRSLSSQIS